MTEEEYFRKTYPDFCYSSGKPLSPYWDLFQDGVEFGERQSEEKIEEIENYFVKSAGYGRDKVRNFMDIVNKALRQKGERIEELEQKLEQTEKDLADYQFNYPKIKELEQENAELKEKLKPENCLKLLAKEGYIKFTSEQFPKATEIIKGLYFIIQSRIDYENNTGISDEMWRAKQFLEETK